MHTRLLSAASVLLSLTSLSTAQVATFENFAEGESDIALYDASTGISLFGSTSPDQTLTIEAVAADVARPKTSPGNLLSADGFSPGGAFALPLGFGFTAILPTVTDTLSFDVVYALQSPATAGTFNLNLFDEADALLVTLPQSFSGPDFSEQHVAIPTRLTPDVYSFTISDVTGLYLAYDNIAMPEPTFAATMILFASAGRRRR